MAEHCDCGAYPGGACASSGGPKSCLSRTEQTKVVPSLLPCPFCGGPARLERQGHVECESGRHCRGSAVFVNYGTPREQDEAAITAWNRRATPAPVSGGEDALPACAYRWDGKRWVDPDGNWPPKGGWRDPSPPSPGSEGAGEVWLGVDLASGPDETVECEVSASAWGADAMHKAASDTAPDAGHVKGTGEQAGEVVAWLHSVVHAPDAEPDQALSFAPDSFPFSDTELFRSVRAEPLVLASALAQARAEAKLFASQRDREHAKAKLMAREVTRLKEYIAGFGEPATTDELIAERDRLREGLRAIAEGNLGDGPGQAGYARIRLIARDTLLASGGEGG